ncbi:MAG: translation initiation factor IF-6 [Candidatus Freyarchaeota archaeon]|nr:translation initiation factor IF-6 [Thermoplasmata archaeon]HHH77972.1 translation initiation factor IF-6 [Thermoplasmatales archaeon]
MLKRLDFNNNPYLGVFCRANDEVAFVTPLLQKKERKTVEESLNVKTVELTIGGSAIVGSLMAMNSHGAVVADFIGEDEIGILEKSFDGNFLVIKDNFNAAGNNILANDNGAIVHPMMDNKTIKDIKGVLDVEVERGTIAGIKTVGMAAVATNRGVLCHPKLEDEEKKRLEDMFGVRVDIGTINHGVPYVGAGMVANGNGAIAGSKTTGIEMGRIEDALDLIGE